MNTKNLKSYAPKARKQFIEAVKKRAAHFGIYEDRIAEVRIEGGAAIIEGRAFTRQEGEQRKRLESKLAERGYDMFTREIAYTWFNRLAALRYMEIHDYFDHGFRVLSPAKSHLSNADSLPEILNHASDVAESLNLDKNHIIELQLAGDKEEELYRELLLGQCHQLAKIMPQIFKGLAFETIDDATELLLPNNLTKTDSILKGLINDIPEEDWQQIEVIGWLYQFYISEHKDAVIGKVVKSEDIPAATQLFTPNWIVKYLVQNSVGRQWLATYPDSDLKDKMEYYIEPAEQSEDVIEQLKAITPTSIDPEEIKVLDPACGSGHILVEVYEVLREIYLERGYRLREIPELILTKNIYGLDIDDRAAQLGGFALMMKAREDDRRVFERFRQRVEGGEVALNVYSLQSSEHLDIPKLWKALDLEGNQQAGSTGGLFDSSENYAQPTGVYGEYFELLHKLKTSFVQAKNLGSLIQVEHHNLNNLLGLKAELDRKIKSTDPGAKQAATNLLQLCNQAIVLADRYNVVIANPPYLATKGMNANLKSFVKDVFPSSKADLFSVYIERCEQLTLNNGDLALVTPYVWMFLGTYEKLRKLIFQNKSITSLVQPSYTSFFDSAIVPLLGFTIVKGVNRYLGKYTNLGYLGNGDEQPFRLKEAISGSEEYPFYTRSVSHFEKVPGKPIGYWIDENIFEIFESYQTLRDICYAGFGIKTGNNEVFMKEWHEVNIATIEFNQQAGNTIEAKWFPCASGGAYRKWYGNQNLIVNYQNSGKDIEGYAAVNGNSYGFNGKKYYFKKSITWPKLTSSDNSFRSTPSGHIFDGVGLSAFFENEDDYYILNSSIKCNHYAATRTSDCPVNNS
ncbi:BREX-1 system adenine-specific DNA-methyltransferase PglX [Pseudoalteromonas sp. AOP31-A2-14]|uniref:BREX-1 system adenine-specific DNA-methyltransferase PglX n=1 Tax=Pseudoalteromonas sp. AOP31-A2-14 TaxID=3457695 RepID=UPI004036C687